MPFPLEYKDWALLKRNALGFGQNFHEKSSCVQAGMRPKMNDSTIFSPKLGSDVDKFPERFLGQKKVSFYCSNGAQRV